MPFAPPLAALTTVGAEHGSIDSTGLLLPRLLSAVRRETHCEGDSRRIASGLAPVAEATTGEASACDGGRLNSLAVPPDCWTAVSSKPLACETPWVSPMAITDTFLACSVLTA